MCGEERRGELGRAERKRRKEGRKEGSDAAKSLYGREGGRALIRKLTAPTARCESDRPRFMLR